MEKEVDYVKNFIIMAKLNLKETIQTEKNLEKVLNFMIMEN